MQLGSTPCPATVELTHAATRDLALDWSALMYWAALKANWRFSKGGDPEDSGIDERVLGHRLLSRTYILRVAMSTWCQVQSKGPLVGTLGCWGVTGNMKEWQGAWLGTSEYAAVEIDHTLCHGCCFLLLCCEATELLSPG